MNNIHIIQESLHTISVLYWVESSSLFFILLRQNKKKLSLNSPSNIKQMYCAYLPVLFLFCSFRVYKYFAERASQAVVVQFREQTNLLHLWLEIRFTNLGSIFRYIQFKVSEGKNFTFYELFCYFIMINKSPIWQSLGCSGRELTWRLFQLIEC